MSLDSLRVADKPLKARSGRWERPGSGAEAPWPHLGPAAARGRQRRRRWPTETGDGRLLRRLLRVHSVTVGPRASKYSVIRCVAIVREWVVQAEALAPSLAASFAQGPIIDDQGRRFLTEETVATLGGGLKVQIFSREHPPPHFRVFYAGRTRTSRSAIAKSSWAALQSGSAPFGRGTPKTRASSSMPTARRPRGFAMSSAIALGVSMSTRLRPFRYVCQSVSCSCSGNAVSRSKSATGTAANMACSILRDASLGKLLKLQAGFPKYRTHKVAGEGHRFQSGRCWTA